MKKKIVRIGAILLIFMSSFLFGYSYQKDLKKLKKNLPGDFNLVVSEPFAITGDISQSWMKKVVRTVVEPYSNAMYNSFFDTKASYLIKIYLLKSEKSYHHYSRLLFNSKPGTPFGFYLPHYRSLVMDTSYSGMGTLVHEMFHALVEADFDKIPSWLNEGMGSLYERCYIRNQHIYGDVNWRLPILQRGLKQGKYVSLRKLMSTSTNEFYKDENGMHYSEARYICYYMQEKGVLRKFYQLFRHNYQKDKSGIKYVEQVFDNRKLEEIEKDWLDYVNLLNYNE